MNTAYGIGVGASAIGMVPALFLGTLRRHIDAAWWWLAVAFGLSFVTDMIALGTGKGWLLSFIYPVVQTSLVAAVFLRRSDALAMLALFVAVGLVSAMLEPVGKAEILLRTIAWSGVVGIMWDRPALGWLRWSLITYFGIGLLAWWAYALWPGWWTWGTYQGTRLAGILTFCRAAWKPVQFRVYGT